jgi:hypothetical protein
MRGYRELGAERQISREELLLEHVEANGHSVFSKIGQEARSELCRLASSRECTPHKREV